MPRPASPTEAVTTEGAPSALPADVTIDKRVVVSLGRRSGTSVLRAGPGGRFSSTLDVVENGRGPHVDATFELAADGTLTVF